MDRVSRRCLAALRLLLVAVSVCLLGAASYAAHDSTRREARDPGQPQGRRELLVGLHLLAAPGLSWGKPGNPLDRHPTWKHVACPTCGKPVLWVPENTYRPFCSDRCHKIDLGAWARRLYVGVRVRGETTIRVGELTGSIRYEFAQL